MWKTLRNALLGPLLLHLLLLTNVVYRALFSTPASNVETQLWPQDTSQAQKNRIITHRKSVFEAYKKALGGQTDADFLDRLWTDDGVFESPFFRFEGRDELRHCFGPLLTSMTPTSDFHVLKETHAPHEMVVEYEAHMKLFGFLPLATATRTHLLFEPPSTSDGHELLFKVVDEWQGNPLINELNTLKPLARIHRKLRRFQAFVLALISDTVSSI